MRRGRKRRGKKCLVVSAIRLQVKKERRNEEGGKIRKGGRRGGEEREKDAHGNLIIHLYGLRK